MTTDGEITKTCLCSSRDSGQCEGDGLPELETGFNSFTARGKSPADCCGCAHSCNEHEGGEEFTAGRSAVFVYLVSSLQARSLAGISVVGHCEPSDALGCRALLSFGGRARLCCGPSVYSVAPPWHS